MFVREGIAVEDDGVLVVRFEDRERLMLIEGDLQLPVRHDRSRGVSLRVQELDSDEVVYVVDGSGSTSATSSTPAG